jgi:hypothetical protein
VVDQQLLSPGESVITRLQVVLLWGQVHGPEEEVEDFLGGDVGFSKNTPHLGGQLKNGVPAVPLPYLNACTKRYYKVLLEVVKDGLNFRFPQRVLYVRLRSREGFRGGNADLLFFLGFRWAEML